MTFRTALQVAVEISWTAPCWVRTATGRQVRAEFCFRTGGCSVPAGWGHSRGPSASGGKARQKPKERPLYCAGSGGTPAPRVPYSGTQLAWHLHSRDQQEHARGQAGWVPDQLPRQRRSVCSGNLGGVSERAWVAPGLVYSIPPRPMTDGQSQEVNS